VNEGSVSQASFSSVMQVILPEPSRGHGEQVVVGAPGGLAAGHGAGLQAVQDLGGEHHFLAVRSDGHFLHAAPGEGGHVGVQVRHQIHRALVQLHAVQVEQVAALAVFPGVPVPEQQLVVDHAGGLLLGQLGVVGHGLGHGHAGVDFHGDEEAVDGGHQFHVADAQVQVGELGGLAAGGVDVPDLHAAAAGAQEEQGAVHAPARVPVTGRVAGQALGLAAVGAAEPDVGAAAVGLEVGGAHVVGHPLPVRRDLGIADAVHGQHVMNGEGMLLRVVVSQGG
jgi:hypothetical protein